MTRRTWGILVLLASLRTAAAGAVLMRDNPTGCTVQTDHYRLTVDVGVDPMVRLLDREGQRELTALRSLWLEQDGQGSAATGGLPRPHFHPLREGPYLVELHIENIVLRQGASEWPGLAELSLFCHEDRVYFLLALLAPNGQWVNRGLYVYEALEGHRQCPAVTVTRCGLGFGLASDAALPEMLPAGAVLNGPPALVFHPTTPLWKSITTDLGTVTITSPPREPLSPGGVFEVGGEVMVGLNRPGAERALADEIDPLPPEAFTMAMGQAAGFDPARGVYALTAQTSGTPEPPRGLRAGTRFTVRNTARARRLLIDQRDPWGGIGGGIVRDGNGQPLPIVPQFGLNFPEHHADAKEPGWATMTYPLDLAPNETREIRGEHLYHALSDREIIYLTSLEDIGDPLLLQTTVGRGESHTLTTGPYPGDRTPGNELRINDFRRLYSQLKVRSVSAILPTFFGYWGAEGKYQGLMPGFISFRETSPFLIEYTVEAATSDGAVTGRLRVWQAAQADMTRVFTDVSLDVRKPIRLSADRPAPLFFLRHHAFNPMAYRKFAFTGAAGTPVAGDLDFLRAVVVNGARLGPLPFATLYQASNGLDQGLPCSDITGNPGFVLLDWNVVIGGRPVTPGCYAFTCGANDGGEDGAYARDVAVVPTDKITEVPTGSHIRYRAMQVVFGDNASDPQAMEAERDRWALHPLTVTANVGQVVSSDPPEIRVVPAGPQARNRAEFELRGGADWLPVRVFGLQPGKMLHVRQTDSTGTRELGPGAPDEPWYNAWPAPGGRCGVTFLVKTVGDGSPLRLEVWQ